jgi:ribosomal protein S18 acetylase RimI-like enzyme
MEEEGMDVHIEEMTLDDYDQVAALWRASASIELSDTDSREGVARFLGRNPGLSLVARVDGRVVGAVLCGHDGRRGYIDQLVVAQDCRRQGIGRSMVARCLYNLMRQGIRRLYLFVFDDNDDAVAFWRQLGWSPRVEMVTMSRPVTPEM